MGMTLLRSPRVHPTLSPEGLREAFEGKAGAAGWAGGWISSPHHLLAVELERERVGVPEGAGVPTDIFLWGQGEPKDRTLTKVGGLPYWPFEKAWPVGEDGELVFLAQFNFVDSKDLVGELPGDLLLLFSDARFSWAEGNRAGLVPMWVRLGTERLIVERTLPKVKNPFFKGYGVIHRAMDWAGEGDGGRVLDATKIGGVLKGARTGVPSDWKPLAQLGPIQPTAGLDFPWVNRPRPLGETMDAAGVAGVTNRWVLGGGRFLGLYLDKVGGLEWELA
jgi:hypothetical protein